MDKITGHISEIPAMHGNVSTTVSISGGLSIPGKIGNRYKGNYEVVPETQFQLLPTAECYLEDDILVHPIPYAEVSNTSGGYTATIGG